MESRKLIAWIFASGVAGLGAPFQASLAQEATPVAMRSYTSVMFSHVFPEDERDRVVGGGSGAFKDGNGLQIGVGFPVNEHFGMELSVFGHGFDQGSEGGPSLRELGGKVDGLFFYSRKAEFSPYFGLGVGVVDNKINNGESSSDAFADVGLGFMKFFNVSGRDLAFRGELRYRRIFLGNDAFERPGLDDIEEAVLRIGVVIPVGDRASPAGGWSAASSGASSPPPPAAALTAAQEEEETAATAASAAAGKDGEETTDSDGDGVMDGADLCPETPVGTQVDVKGCPVDPVVDKDAPSQKFEDVHFAFDQSRLTDYARTLLDNAARVINSLAERHPRLQVQVLGHTDWIGTDGYNQGLGERRAQVVRDYLVRKGVEGARITMRSYGETRPKATNDTAEGRALNRRAEVLTRDQ